METQEIPVPGGTLAVHMAGQGPVILFVHGFPLDHQMWSGQLPLAARFRCIMPDLRGFGASTASVPDVLTMSQLAEDLDCVLQATAAGQRVCVCGLSMGGYVAFELWNRSADRIGRLILCDTRAASDSAEVARGRELSALQIAEQGSGDFVAAMMGKLFGPTASPRSRQLIERVMQSVAPASLSAALLGMAQRSNFSLRLPEIGVPTLAICGRQDGITPPDEMRQMADRLPLGQFVAVDDAGHMAPLEQPERANAEIERWFISSEQGT